MLQNNFGLVEKLIWSIPFIWLVGMIFGFIMIGIAIGSISELDSLEGSDSLTLSKYFCFKDGLLWLTFKDGTNVCMSFNQVHEYKMNYDFYEYKTWWGSTTKFFKYQESGMIDRRTEP